MRTIEILKQQNIKIVPKIQKNSIYEKYSIFLSKKVIKIIERKIKERKFVYKIFSFRKKSKFPIKQYEKFPDKYKIKSLINK